MKFICVKVPKFIKKFLSLFTKKKNRECEENVCTATVPQEDDQQENNN
ncbi:unknown [Acidaminococcus sp. CAG:917]|nr:unknown [Acidaminococcus sp. CAG:917]